MRDTERWSERERQEALNTAFRVAFGTHRPTHLARAPGRVNLIGEHTDYNGLPVFPMAIQRDVALSFRMRDDNSVSLCNVDPRYPPREFTIADSIARFAPGAAGDWGNYAKSAAQALRKRFGITRGIDAAIHGDIPPAAGLSSSSAMVVACALALIRANDVEIELMELMSFLAEAERYIGTQSGGMDQAISLGGRRGEAMVIEFDPLRLTPVRVPASWCFVIANSLVRAEKAGAAQLAYNTRTVECRAALAAVADHPKMRALWSELAIAHGELPRYAALVNRVPIAELLDISNDALPDPLRRRFRHVVTEGRRVYEARAAMLANDIDAFGRLMNASHESLRDDYEVSCPELDRLADVARAAGAAGARLTGAGFGGCIVAVCERNRCELLVADLRRAISSSCSDVPMDAVMIAEPSDGARVVESER